MERLSDILRAAADRLDSNGGDVAEVIRVIKQTPTPKSRKKISEEERIVNEIVENAMYGH